MYSSTLQYLLQGESLFPPPPVDAYGYYCSYGRTMGWLFSFVSTSFLPSLSSPKLEEDKMKELGYYLPD